MKYTKPTAVPTCPAVGSLYQAREWKKRAWMGVIQLRQRLRECRMGEAGSIRLELLKAERAHFDAKLTEEQCLRDIERRANELGLTTKREVPA